MSRLAAAVQGTHEMIVPVLFAVGTNIIAFIPLLLKNVADLDETVGEIESALRKIQRDAEADKIRKAFDDWVEDVEK